MRHEGEEVEVKRPLLVSISDERHANGGSYRCHSASVVQADRAFDLSQSY